VKLPNRAAVVHGAAAVLLIAATAIPASSRAATLRVGPDKFYKTVTAAAEAAQPGDMILIDAGEYRGAACLARWKTDDLTVRGVGGRAHMRADGAQVGGKGIWIVSGRNFTAENIEFSGAAVPDRNGAGIRSETEGTLILRDCSFHGNQNGILGGADSMLVEGCTFDRNGAGDGKTHNLYVWGRAFTMRYSWSGRAVVGHNVKTRAKNNYILYNRICDEADGTASYEIDVPDCGRTYLIGNVVEQGPRSENSGIVAYGMESGENISDLYVINNTLVNDRAAGGTFLQLREGTRARVVNNIFVGPGTTWSGGDVAAQRNYVEPDLRNGARFLAAAAFDFRLTKASPRSIVDAGVAPGASVTGFDLTPVLEYLDQARARPRRASGALDLGAFELEAK
jgi:hypothetical protein